MVRRWGMAGLLAVVAAAAPGVPGPAWAYYGDPYYGYAPRPYYAPPPAYYPEPPRALYVPPPGYYAPYSEPPPVLNARPRPSRPRPARAVTRRPVAAPVRAAAPSPFDAAGRDAPALEPFVPPDLPVPRPAPPLPRVVPPPLKD